MPAGAQDRSIMKTNDLLVLEEIYLSVILNDILLCLFLRWPMVILAGSVYSVDARSTPQMAFPAGSDDQ